jgi:hypothetical protein
LLGALGDQAEGSTKLVLIIEPGEVRYLQT